MIKKKHIYKMDFLSPIELLFRLLDNDIERPAEFPDKTLDACSMLRIRNEIGCCQLFKRRRALVRGSNESNASFLLMPSSVSLMSLN